MESPILEAVENIIHYKFNNKKLLEEALTHSSFNDAVSYERLEFIGDPILSVAISNHLFMAYPNLDPGHLSLLRAANISTEKLARAAVRLGLHRFVRHNAPSLVPHVQRFADAVAQEDFPLPYGGSVKAPKVLADIVEAIAGAVYVDVDYDIRKLWLIFRGLLKPIVTPDDLQPQPVTMLFEICHKNGKHVVIECQRISDRSIASVFVDGEFVASASSDQKDLARLEAAKIALHKLSHLVPPTDVKLNFCVEEDGTLVVEAAKHKLNEFCGVKKWPKPVYRIVKNSGPSHEKRFVCAVEIDGILRMSGNEKSRVKDAQKSAASLMILALQEYNYL